MLTELFVPIYPEGKRNNTSDLLMCINVLTSCLKFWYTIWYSIDCLIHQLKKNGKKDEERRVRNSSMTPNYKYHDKCREVLGIGLMWSNSTLISIDLDLISIKIHARLLTPTKISYIIQLLKYIYWNVLLCSKTQNGRLPRKNQNSYRHTMDWKSIVMC